MDEHILDDLALNNALSGTNSHLKLLLGISSILICVFSPSFFTPLVVGISMAAVTVGLAKIPLQEYITLLMIPVTFAASGAIVILFLTGGGDPIISLSLFGTTLTATTGGANLSLLVLSRTFGGMSALFFIALSTPMIQIFTVFHDLKFPREFIDLSMMVYRLIFIFIGEAIAIHNAQVMRNGYNGLKNSVHALSMLCGALFIKAWVRGEEMLIAMDSRCYDGKFEQCGAKQTIGILPAAATGAYLCGCSVLAVVFSGVTLF